MCVELNRATSEPTAMGVQGARVRRPRARQVKGKEEGSDGRADPRAVEFEGVGGNVVVGWEGANGELTSRAHLNPPLTRIPPQASSCIPDVKFR